MSPNARARNSTTISNGSASSMRSRWPAVRRCRCPAASRQAACRSACRWWRRRAARQNCSPAPSCSRIYWGYAARRQSSPGWRSRKPREQLPLTAPAGKFHRLRTHAQRHHGGACHGRSQREHYKTVLPSPVLGDDREPPERNHGHGKPDALLQGKHGADISWVSELRGGRGKLTGVRDRRHSPDHNEGKQQPGRRDESERACQTTHTGDDKGADRNRRPSIDIGKPTGCDGCERTSNTNRDECG